MPQTEDPIKLETRDGLFPPVTGTEGVLVMSDGAEVAASVGASVGALVLVDSTVTGGTLVLGTLVDVCCPPHAASSKAESTSIVKNKLALLILTFSPFTTFRTKRFPSC